MALADNPALFRIKIADLFRNVHLKIEIELKNNCGK